MTKPIDDFENVHYNPMTHQEAQELNAIELYVLKELTAEQERRFEEHYFECPECANAVALEQTLAANIRPVIPKRLPLWQRLAFPVLAPLAASLAGILFFQHAQMADLEMAKANTIILAQQDLMGPEEEPPSIHTPSVTIELALHSKPTYPSLRVDVSKNETKPIFSVVIPTPDDSRVSIQTPKQKLSPGSYNVMVFGLATQDSKDGPPIEKPYHFKIQ